MRDVFSTSKIYLIKIFTKVLRLNFIGYYLGVGTTLVRWGKSDMIFIFIIRLFILNSVSR